jgi:hypothetical protein
VDERVKTRPLRPLPSASNKWKRRPRRTEDCRSSGSHRRGGEDRRARNFRLRRGHHPLRDSSNARMYPRAVQEDDRSHRARDPRQHRHSGRTMEMALAAAHQLRPDPELHRPVQVLLLGVDAIDLAGGSPKKRHASATPRTGTTSARREPRRKQPRLRPEAEARRNPTSGRLRADGMRRAVVVNPIDRRRPGELL